MSIIRSSLLLGAGAAAAGGLQVSRSLRFNGSVDSAYLSRTPASAGNRRTWTWSGWAKRSKINSSWVPLFEAYDGSSLAEANYLQLTFYSDQIGLATDTVWLRRTTAVYRDYSAWMHVVCAFDTTQSTGADRVKIYVNGAQVTAFTTSSDPTINTDYGVNRNVEHKIGRRQSTDYFDGYLADVYFIDGQALTPASFAETDATTGQWIPKAFSGGSYGTNGFYLKFDDNSSNTASTLGKDTSGNGNNWTPNNLSVTAGAGNDSLVDSPTNYGTDTGVGGEVRGNYAVWNALAKGSDCTLSNGNLDVAWGSAGSTTQGSATFGMSSGKWYWETTITASSASPTNAVLGITTKPFGDSEYPGYSGTSWGYRGSDGQKWNNTSGASYGASYANGDVVGVAFDADSGTLTFYKNGSSQGTAFSSLTSGPYFPAIGDQSSAQTFSAATNFGQRAFAYTAPSGFKALCTQNLPEGTITTSGTFTGNASADGPFVYLNGVPTAMTINSNAVTFATHADKLSNGFKLRTSSGSYNTAGSNTYSITTTGDKFKYARAQPNP